MAGLAQDAINLKLASSGRVLASATVRGRRAAITAVSSTARGGQANDDIAGVSYRARGHSDGVSASVRQGASDWLHGHQ